MSDICEQLRKAGTHALMSASRQTVLDAAAEIERLRLTARDQFAAAALTGLMATANTDDDPTARNTPSDIAYTAYEIADAMLRERGASAEKYSDVRNSQNANTTDHDAAPAAKAAPSVSSVPLGKGLGTGDTFGLDAYRRFVGEVMSWISEATSIYEPRSDGGRRIMADACMKCWDAFNRIAYPTTNHDAAPATRARTDADSDRTDKAVSRPGEGTGDTPVTEPMPILLSGSGFVTPVSYAKSDEKRVNWPADRDTTQPRNGTPAEGSVQGESTEPVAWAVADPECRFRVLCFERDNAFIEKRSASENVVPLYRHPQPTLTDEEREAVQVARDAYADDDGNAECEQIAAVLSRLLERTK